MAKKNNTVRKIDTTEAEAVVDKLKSVGTMLEMAPNDLVENAWNPNAMGDFMFGRLKANIQLFGFTVPVVVRTGDESGPFEDGRFEVIDGAHRCRAAVELGLETIRVLNLGNVPTHKAKTMTLTLNRVQGKDDQDALSTLVSELATFGSEITDVLPYDENELNALSHMAADLNGLDDLADLTAETGSVEEEEGMAENHTVSILQLDGLLPLQDKNLAARVRAVADKLTYDDAPGSLLEVLLDAVAKGLKIDVSKAALESAAPESDEDDLKEVVAAAYGDD